MVKGGLVGYSYQDTVQAYFALLMDLERKIICIQSEVKAESASDMDDLLVKTVDEKYYIQCKNITGLNLSDIVVNGNDVIIKGNIHILSKIGINVIIARNLDIQSNHVFMGLRSTVVGKVTVCSFCTDNIDILSSRYKDPARLNSVFLLSKTMIENRSFILETKDLPILRCFSVELLNETVNITRNIRIREKKVNCILGKPGSGKSHLAYVLSDIHHNSILYRFWISNSDSDYKKRLEYANFIDDISKHLFNSPEKRMESDIIKTILERKIVLIIDGLDHVQKYNKIELKKYCSFINNLINCTVIVLSRPFNELRWDKIWIDNWDRLECVEYLHKCEIDDNRTIDEIYSCGNGYPLLTYYLVSYYKTNGVIPKCGTIKEIEEYYNYLVDDEIRDRLLIFLIGSYITRDDLIYLEGSEATKYIVGFVNENRGLFNIELNRISLFHDSFCNFLSDNLNINIDDESKILEKIIYSIMNGEIRFISRYGSYPFDFDSKSFVIKKYASLLELEQLFRNTLDWESIIEFYDSIKRDLEQYPGLLDYYEYYSFISCTLIVERSLSITDENFVYNFLQQLIMNKKTDSDIFSNGMLWALYVKITKQDNRDYISFLEKNYRYRVNQVQLFDDYIRVEELKMTLPDCQELYVRQELEPYSTFVSRYAVLKMIYGDKTDEVRALIENYLNDQCGYESRLRDFIISMGAKEEHDIKMSIHDITDRLYFMGRIRKNNPYLLLVAEIIKRYSKDGSFKVGDVIHKMLRLSNYEGRLVDISEIWKYYFMYGNRKDSSVLGLPDALFVYEHKKLISVEESVWIISNLQNMSEKGIWHLLSEYMNVRADDAIRVGIRYDLFYDFDYIRFEKLKSHIVDMLPIYVVRYHIISLLRYDCYTKTINYSDISNFIGTRYLQELFYAINQCDYSIRNVPDNEVALFSSVSYTINSDNDSEKKVHNLKIDGYLAYDDEIEVKSGKIKMLELCDYLDGWYNAMPYPDFFRYYTQNEVKENLLTIIHKQIYAKTKFGGIGTWYFCMSSIPKLMCYSGENVDWERMFTIFKKYLVMSEAWNLDTVKGCIDTRVLQIISKSEEFDT